MCGFAGIFADAGHLAGGLEPTTSRMADTLHHRGPDDTGIWSDPVGGIAFGFRRLSIVDLSPLGHQPMRSGSGRFALVFNGEVYNEGDLRRELAAEGHEFKGRSDTEVVLAAIERWGVPRALERFIGMFALALWDGRLRTLTLARDRVGIKPLFVYADTRMVAFASELKALMAHPAVDRTISADALDRYLRHLYVPAPHTIFQRAWKILPGHYLTVRTPHGPLPPSESYWRVEGIAERGQEDPYPGGDREAVDELERLLLDAVSLRMRSDVPVGAFLSGGIDSSTVVALMQHVSPRPARTFSIGFGDSEHDESRHAARVAEHLGTDHTALHLTGEDALEVVPCLPSLFDEPLADPSQIPTHLVSKLARRQVTVALSGDGGDELFGGYNRYVHGAKVIRGVERVPGVVRQLVGRGIGSLPASRWSRAYELLRPVLPGSLRYRLAGQKLAKIGVLLREEDAPSMYVSLVSACQAPERLTGGRVERSRDVEGILGKSVPPTLSDRMALADQLWYLPDDLLAKVDRASMATSLEVRVPILDHRVVEFSWRLPPAMKIREGRGKWILRQVLDRWVPRELVDRPKVGFSVPIESWLRGPLREWGEDLLSSNALGRHGLLSPDSVRGEWRRFLEGRNELGLSLWAVLMFQAWSDRWLS